MPTEPTVDVDLDLVATEDPETPCYECQQACDHFQWWTRHEGVKVALWHLFTRDTCPCLPNPVPLCDMHKEISSEYLIIHGPLDWICSSCGHRTDVYDIRRILR